MKRIIILFSLFSLILLSCSPFKDGYVAVCGGNEVKNTVAEERWWTHNVYQKNPDRMITIDSMQIYKVRPVW